MVEPKTPRREGPRPGRRRRRLRRTAIGVGLVLVVGIVAALVWRLSLRPEVRRPGEALEDVTDNLARTDSGEAPEPMFVDATAAAGLAELRTFAGERTSQLPEDMGPGIAWGDVDRDGDDDLLVVAVGGAVGTSPDDWATTRLWENRGDGSFRPDERFPEQRIQGMAAAFGDADGDGRLDVVLTGFGVLRLFLQRHDGTWEQDRRFAEPDGFWAGASWGDFDGDRDLDLYVCGYVDYRDDASSDREATRQYGATVPYTLNPSSYPAVPNLLLVNAGDGTFEDGASRYGVSNPDGRSLGAVWHDFDADGLLDLYVANDISDNALFLNRGDVFESAGLQALVADYRGAMGLTVGDWDRDGDDDLFVTHWLAQENALYSSRLLGPDGHAGRLTFGDLSAPVGLGAPGLPMVGWGTEWVDFDADGWVDLPVVNGSTLEVAGDPSRLRPQPPFLFWNRHGEDFVDLAPRSPPWSVERVGRGLAASDFDLDGDVDLVFTEQADGVHLLRNETEQGHWIQLELRSRGPGGRPTGRGEGSTVLIRGDDEVVHRRSVGSVSYLSQSSARIHVGLGAASRIEQVEVRWLGGEVETWGPLAADTAWRLTEAEEEPERLWTRVDTAGLTDRERIARFWEVQRAAMDRLKRDGDLEAAVRLLRQGLELQPGHQDSRYYLATSLAALGHHDEALRQLDRLRRENPGSHRAHRQWALLRTLTAESSDHLSAARAAAERAREINQEETGALLVLGELTLILSEAGRADELLEAVTRTNPRAVGALYLRAWLAESSGQRQESRRLLAAAHDARGEDWKPEGAVAEGDVGKRMHRERTIFSPAWEVWDGALEPAEVFAGLEEEIDRYRSLPPASD